MTMVSNPKRNPPSAATAAKNQILPFVMSVASNFKFIRVDL